MYLRLNTHRLLLYDISHATLKCLVSMVIAAGLELIQSQAICINDGGGGVHPTPPPPPPPPQKKKKKKKKIPPNPRPLFPNFLFGYPRPNFRFLAPTTRPLNPRAPVPLPSPTTMMLQAGPVGRSYRAIVLKGKSSRWPVGYSNAPMKAAVQNFTFYIIVGLTPRFQNTHVNKFNTPNIIKASQ